LLEREQGVFRADGVFALEPFFDAASEAGIYLLARPGPYINAEVSGGGFPGWLTRMNATFRTNDTGFLDATNLYMQNVGDIIAKAQITNGGPVILFQPENEYTNPANNITFPNDDYFQYIIDQIRNASIVVPLISNDASPKGIFSPDNASYSTHVDVYGHDGYSLGFNCMQPYNWTNGSLPTTWRALHEQQSPSTPYSIVEFQGGSFDPWGGYGFENCAALTNEQFERIFYKNNWSFRVSFFNLYMTYGGTNWGNLGMSKSVLSCLEAQTTSMVQDLTY
jgi:beta-galactosidase GanA